MLALGAGKAGPCKPADRPWAEEGGAPFAAMAESKLVHCVFFLNRACRKGDACPFLHDASLFAKVEDARREERKRTACVFHRRGTCTKGDACPFAHEGPPGVDAVAPRETKAVGAAAAGSSRPPPRARDEPDRTEPQPAPAQKKKKEFGSAARARARELGMLPSSNRGVGGGNDTPPLYGDPQASTGQALAAVG